MISKKENKIGEQIQEIINLLKYLNIDCGITYETLAIEVKKVSKHKLSPAKEDFSKIIKGQKNFLRSTDIIPIWIETLKQIVDEQSVRLVKNSFSNKSYTSFYGNYLGFYIDNDTKKIRLTLITLKEDHSMELGSETYFYKGHFKFESDVLIGNINGEDKNEAIVLYSNLNGSQNARKHIEVMVMSYSFKNGRGIEIGCLVAIYVGNEIMCRTIFDNLKLADERIYSVTTPYFQKYIKYSKKVFAETTKFIIPKCIYELEELDLKESGGSN